MVKVGCGIDFINMSPTERAVTIFIMVGLLIVALIADRIRKWK